jgi:hypothetical protein
MMGCEKNNLTQRPQGARARKEPQLCFLCAFYGFASLRDMHQLIRNYFTADAVGYILSTVPRACFINELLT